MKIILTINNHIPNYDSAITYFKNILKKIEEHSNLICKIGESNRGIKGLVDIKNFDYNLIEKIVEKGLKKDLLDKKDINSSNIGYTLNLIGLAKNNFRCGLMFRYGGYKTSGRDTIYISINDELFENIDLETLNSYFIEINQLFVDLVRISKPQKAIITDYLLSNRTEINRMLVGYTTYLTGAISENLNTSNSSVISTEFEDGILLMFKTNKREKLIEEISSFYLVNKTHFDRFNDFGEGGNVSN